MRKMLVILLLSSTIAAPAISLAQQPQHHGGSGQHRSSSPQSRPTGPSGAGPHGSHGQPSQHARPSGPGASPQHVTHGQSWQHARPANPGVRGESIQRGGTITHHPQHTLPGGPAPIGSGVDQHRRTGVPPMEGRPSNRSVDRVPQFGHRGAPAVSSTPRIGTEPPLRHERRPSAQPHWNYNWRHDRRYDWQDYRQQHRSVYHLGYYRDPYGWGYQAYSIGWRLWPFYYSSSYWITDPWMYRLPPAPPGTRWIRYYDDAVLVDEWTGEVLDVIQGFFW